MCQRVTGNRVLRTNISHRSHPWVTSIHWILQEMEDQIKTSAHLTTEQRVARTGLLITDEEKAASDKLFAKAREYHRLYQTWRSRSSGCFLKAKRRYSLIQSQSPTIWHSSSKHSMRRYWTKRIARQPRSRYWSCYLNFRWRKNRRKTK